MNLEFPFIKMSLELDQKQVYRTPQIENESGEQKVELMQRIFKIEKNRLCYFKQRVEQFRVDYQVVFSRINFNRRDKEIIAFINGRLIENESLWKIVKQGYKDCWNCIKDELEQGFIVYISIRMEQRNIDCNCHPSKTKVVFANE